MTVSNENVRQDLLDLRKSVRLSLQFRGLSQLNFTEIGLDYFIDDLISLRVEKDDIVVRFGRYHSPEERSWMTLNLDEAERIDEAVDRELYSMERGCCYSCVDEQDVDETERAPFHGCYNDCVERERYAFRMLSDAYPD